MQTSRNVNANPCFKIFKCERTKLLINMILDFEILTRRSNSNNDVIRFHDNAILLPQPTDNGIPNCSESGFFYFEQRFTYRIDFFSF